jgi:uncharacterized protein (TIGR02597 family)
LIPNQEEVGMDKAPQVALHFVKDEGWRKSGQPDGSQSAFVLGVGDSFTIRRMTNGDFDLLALGDVPVLPVVKRIHGGDGLSRQDYWFSSSFPEPLSLSQMGLVDSSPAENPVKASLSTDEPGDEILVFNPSIRGFDRGPERVFVFVEGTGWMELGRENDSIENEVIFEAGKSYLLRKQADSPSTDWVQNP